jgi:uncharacterized tellurite resistance protein B-like protein
MNDSNKSGFNNSSHQSADALLQQLQIFKAKSKGSQGIDIPVATAIVLLEIASSDNVIDKFEKSVIHNGLKSIFKISDQTAISVIQKARNALSTMRSSSTDASMLKDILDPATKRAVANLIDSLIRCNGVVDTMEVYLRQRFRSLLGLPEEPLPPRTNE